MFKRRKPEEPPAQRGHVVPASPEPPTAAPARDGGQRGILDGGAAPALAEGGSALGIPSIPAQKPSQVASAPPQQKEPTLMSRPPLQPTPTNSSAPQGMARAPMAPPRLTPQSGERRTLVVGRGISVQGTIQDAERLVVEGTVEASSLNAHELQIAQGGVLKGQIEVEDAEISGVMDGILTVKGSLVLRGSGQVIGEARCRRLQVEDGGQLSGKISMITEPAALSTPAPVADAG